MQELNHKHLLIRASVKNAPVTKEVMNTWLADLVNKIDMKVVIQPISFYVATEGNEGITGSVNIETSNCAIHVRSNLTQQRIELDVYSCKDFTLQPILEKLSEWDLVKFYYIIVDRNGDEFRVIEQDTCERMEIPV